MVDFGSKLVVIFLSDGFFEIFWVLKGGGFLFVNLRVGGVLIGVMGVLIDVLFLALSGFFKGSVSVDADFFLS